MTSPTLSRGSRRSAGGRPPGGNGQLQIDHNQRVMVGRTAPTPASGQPRPGAGYSGTPLARKLGLRPGGALVLVGAPSVWEVPDAPPGLGVRRVEQGQFKGKDLAADGVV